MARSIPDLAQLVLTLRILIEGLVDARKRDESYARILEQRIANHLESCDEAVKINYQERDRNKLIIDKYKFDLAQETQDRVRAQELLDVIGKESLNWRRRYETVDEERRDLQRELDAVRAQYRLVNELPGIIDEQVCPICNQEHLIREPRNKFLCLYCGQEFKSWE